MRFVVSPSDRRRHGWGPLPDGREGLWIDGECCASIAHHPDRETPWATESFAPNTTCSLRNLDTHADAVAHCERFTRFVPRPAQP